MHRLCEYYDLIKAENIKASVMSRNEVEKGWEHFVSFHIIDALHILSVIDRYESIKIVDIGTGGGLPGIPIYIIKEREIERCVLVEAKRKKAVFLKHVINNIGLNNIEIANERAESLVRRPEYWEKFDISLARAVGDTGTTMELTLPFLRIGGKAIIYKGIMEESEIYFSTIIASRLGGKLENIVNYSLAGARNVRNLMIINKIRKTDSKYPRKTGKLGMF